METFNDDEAGYLRWIRNNPTGFVVNAGRLPGDIPDPYMLHRATCSFISSSKIKNYTTTSYMKICSLDKQELLRWAGEYRAIRECSYCKP